MASAPTPRSTPKSAKSSSSSSSTTTTTQPPTTSKPAPSSILPPAHAIHPLSSPLAKAATHTHTLLVPALFVTRFGAIVADPVPALAQLLLPLAAAQVVYCVLCLPPSVDAPTSDEKEKIAAKRRRREKEGAGRLAGRVVPALLSLTLSALTTPLLFALAVLHGAPLTTHTAHTMLLAAHLSLLATQPLFYTHGVSSVVWRQVVSLAAPLDSVRGAALGACLGAWLGAIPIPLDWDREWQKWPCTVVAGVYAGWMLGKALGGSIGFGRIVNFE